MGGALARGGTTDATAGSSVDNAVMHAQQTQKQRVIALRLKNEVVGQFINQQFLPGYTFGWAPRGGMIAYGNEQGHLAIMDQKGNRQEVAGTKAVLLPAWSPDGTQIAHLQRAGKNKYALCFVPWRGQPDRRPDLQIRQNHANCPACSQLRRHDAERLRAGAAADVPIGDRGRRSRRARR